MLGCNAAFVRALFVKVSWSVSSQGVLSNESRDSQTSKSSREAASDLLLQYAQGAAMRLLAESYTSRDQVTPAAVVTLPLLAVIAAALCAHHHIML